MKMKTIIRSVACLLAFVAAGILPISCGSPTPKAPVEGWLEVKGITFAIWRPKELFIGRNPSSEFNFIYLYEEKKGDEKPPTLYIYEGFNPQFFHRQKKGLHIQRSGDVRIGAFQGSEYAGVDESGKYWRELHLRQADQLATLHIWYFEQTKESSAKFDSVIRTLQVRLRDK